MLCKLTGGWQHTSYIPSNGTRMFAVISFFRKRLISGLKGKEVLLSQSTYLAHMQGMAPFLIDKMRVINSRLYDVVSDIDEIDLLKIKLRNELREIRQELTDIEITG